MTTRVPFFLALALALCAGGVGAQYARPGTVQNAPTSGSASPATAAPSMQRPAPGIITPLAPFCFEVIDQRDVTLTTALSTNGLLCPTVAKAGAPARIRATPAGELVGEATGAATVFHRSR